MKADRKEQILDLAERAMRRGGLDAISHRDLASAIGIKSASVHYHFPTKTDLTNAVTARYTERFITSLGHPHEVGALARERIGFLCDGYVQAYRADTSTCLCAVLGSVASNLSPETAAEIETFYKALLNWIADALKGTDTLLTPNVVISLLQGAMVLAVATADEKPLAEAKAYLVSTLVEC